MPLHRDAHQEADLVLHDIGSGCRFLGVLRARFSLALFCHADVVLLGLLMIQAQRALQMSERQQELVERREARSNGLMCRLSIAAP
jgi:hypothetical protein